MPNPRKYREIVKRLRRYDQQFEFWDERGKGSHRIIYHPDINGISRSYPVKCHGNNTELSGPVIADIIKRFELPAGIL